MDTNEAPADAMDIMSEATDAATGMLPLDMVNALAELVEPAEGPLRRHVAEMEMERLAVLRAELLLAWDYGPVRCSSACVFHDHANR